MLSTVSSIYLVQYRTTLVASNSHPDLLADVFLVLRNVLLQLLDFVLQLPDSFLRLRLVAVRGAFARGDSLPVDIEETARGGTSARSPGLLAVGMVLGELGFASAFE